MRTATDAFKRECIDFYFNSNSTITQTCRQYSISEHTFSDWLTERGLTPKNRSLDADTKSLILAMFIKQGKSVKEIADELDIPFTKVRGITSNHSRKIACGGKDAAPKQSIYDNEPVYYVREGIKPKKVTYNGKQYQDVTQLLAGF